MACELAEFRRHCEAAGEHLNAKVDKAQLSQGKRLKALQDCRSSVEAKAQASIEEQASVASPLPVSELQGQVEQLLHLRASACSPLRPPLSRGWTRLRA